jgi:hypothetical protein
VTAGVTVFSRTFPLQLLHFKAIHEGSRVHEEHFGHSQQVNVEHEEDQKHEYSNFAPDNDVHEECHHRQKLCIPQEWNDVLQKDEWRWWKILLVLFDKLHTVDEEPLPVYHVHEHTGYQEHKAQRDDGEFRFFVHIKILFEFILLCTI